jgi:hypothetical protein
LNGIAAWPAPIIPWLTVSGPSIALATTKANRFIAACPPITSSNRSSRSDTSEKISDSTRKYGTVNGPYAFKCKPPNARPTASAISTRLRTMRPSVWVR